GPYSTSLASTVVTASVKHTMKFIQLVAVAGLAFNIRGEKAAHPSPNASQTLAAQSGSTNTWSSTSATTSAVTWGTPAATPLATVGMASTATTSSAANPSNWRGSTS